MADHPASFSTDRNHPEPSKVWRGAGLEAFELGHRARECMATQQRCDRYGLAVELSRNIVDPARWQDA